MSHIETNSGLLHGETGVVEIRMHRDEATADKIVIAVMSPDEALRFAARLVAHATRARELEDALPDSPSDAEPPAESAMRKDPRGLN